MNKRIRMRRHANGQKVIQRNRSIAKVINGFDYIAARDYKPGKITDTTDFIEDLIAMKHWDDRLPHEKVMDTTIGKAPEFYDGFAKLVTDDPKTECQKGLEYLHRQEYNAAHICYLKAARAGYAEGYYRLGGLYLFGRGVSRDYNMAESLYRTAVEIGFVPQADEALAMLQRMKERDEEGV